MNSRPRTTQIFLPDGDSLGICDFEIINAEIYLGVKQ